jgi:hypothetical protein
MTSKKGSLWKSSWNRGRGTPIPDFVGQMAFFENFQSGANNAVYTTSVNSTLGLALPYWFAAVGIGSAPHTVLVNNGFTISPASDVNAVYVDVTVAPGATGTAGLAVAGDQYVSAVVVVVDDAGGGVPRARIYFEDQVVVTAVGAGAYSSPASPLLFSPYLLPGGLHGFGGGPGIPTGVEIHTWFKQLRTLLLIPPIPGKTTHLYSAGVAYPAVPATLTNLGTAGAAQDMTLSTLFGAPTPQNNLVYVRFAY